jgi:hypothetical protein
MPHVKGLVLQSRFEYLDYKQGVSSLTELLKKISTPEANFVRQPVDSANFYPEDILVKIDEILLADHFENDLNEFVLLGKWNARNLISKYFNLYLEEGGPKEFLEQFARLRDSLIGSGEMTISEIGPGKLEVKIDYGQTVPKSICLSEQGFISEGLRLCGARNIKVDKKVCVNESTSLESIYEVSYS